MTSDGAALAALLRSIDGPIILVGHSYGGALLAEVGRATEAVKALVFVAALAPDEGESFGELTARFPGSDLAGALTPRARRTAAPTCTCLKTVMERCWRAILLTPTCSPGAASATGSSSGAKRSRREASLANASCWFIYGDADRGLPPALHQFMAHRAGALASM